MRQVFASGAALIVLAGVAYAAAPNIPADGPMTVPADYREWVFLTSSLDLNYDKPVPDAGEQQVSMLDNVYVNPDSYRAFVATGTWPDKTVLVKDNRVAESAGELSKDGKFQTRIASMELHVKDARLPGGWGFFFTRGPDVPARPVKQTADCYTCHGAHAAVDTTFVQFYPTLLEIAQAKGTLSAKYLAEKKAAK